VFGRYAAKFDSVTLHAPSRQFLVAGLLFYSGFIGVIEPVQALMRTLSILMAMIIIAAVMLLFPALKITL